MHEATAQLDRLIVRAVVSDTHACAFEPKNMVFSSKVIVFAFDDEYSFALLQSNVHEAWIRRLATTMRTDVSYTTSDCFDTFPFPKKSSSENCTLAERVGEQYHEYRRQLMLARNYGLTKTYNLFHNPECRDQDIQRLRELHSEMDRAILACYGWQDLDPKHNFYQNERGQTRFTICTEARREVLRRLLELNLRIAAEESGGK